jgi:hypothetical protein
MNILAIWRFKKSGSEILLEINFDNKLPIIELTAILRASQ